VIRAAAAHTGRLIGAQIAQAKRWDGHGSGNKLRAAVLGANDGLVSNLCLVMGIAGAVSMALGEWLSVTNSREFANSQIAQEKEELEETPDAECKN
jgi:VIT1/CCC1 family predicted Fe2+/Mn2+ transporter